MRYAMTRLGVAAALALAVWTAGPTRCADDNPDQFFNGKNLDGWGGLSEYWSVKDGAIVGDTSAGIKGNTFLCSKQKYRDFELQFQVKLTGKGWDGNSGVQIRSELIDPKGYVVAGPQCDMGSQYWGSLYGERFSPEGKVGGGHMMKAAPADVVRKVLKKDDFNDYYIKCVGKHVTIKLNGETTVDQDFDKLPGEGIIAWQLHVGPPMEVVFRNIHFKDLSAK